MEAGSNASVLLSFYLFCLQKLAQSDKNEPFCGNENFFEKMQNCC